MTRLAVYYDARCGLCCAVRDWIGRQPQLVAVDCLPKTDGDDELLVLADTGEMWAGDSAWLMVLWALRDYRQWAYRLGSPALLPTARTVFATLSDYRGALTCRLGLTPEQPVVRVPRSTALRHAQGVPSLPSNETVEAPRPQGATTENRSNAAGGDASPECSQTFTRGCQVR